jgi:uncharacterized membrane protein YkvA (DUF1232 family)
MFGRIWMLFAVRRNLRLAWRLFRDERVSIASKLPLPLAILYVLSPVDLAPDLIPLLGQMDDVTILFFAVAMFLKLAPPEVIREHLEQMAGLRRPAQKSHGDAQKSHGEVIEGKYRVIK